MRSKGMLHLEYIAILCCFFLLFTEVVAQPYPPFIPQQIFCGHTFILQLYWKNTVYIYWLFVKILLNTLISDSLHSTYIASVKYKLSDSYHFLHSILFATLIYIISQNIQPDMNIATQSPPLAFKKGMTLDEYLSEMATEQHKPLVSTPDHAQENLYQTSKLGEHKLSNKLITYEIRESDEDNYQQESLTSHQNHYMQQTNIHGFGSLGKNKNQDTQRNSNKNIININADFNLTQNSKGFRIRNQSNSPYHIKKKQFSPIHNKNMVKSLYNNQWKQYKEVAPKALVHQGATLYGSNFIKGFSQKANANEKHFKKKNNREIDYLMKYQRQKNSKYSSSTKADFKVEGISDKLHQRKNRMIH